MEIQTWARFTQRRGVPVVLAEETVQVKISMHEPRTDQWKRHGHSTGNSIWEACKLVKLWSCTWWTNEEFVCSFWSSGGVWMSQTRRSIWRRALVVQSRVWLFTGQTSASVQYPRCLTPLLSLFWTSTMSRKNIKHHLTSLTRIGKNPWWPSLYHRVHFLNLQYVYIYFIMCTCIIIILI